MQFSGDSSDNTFDFLEVVSPALKRYTVELATQELNARPDLTPRDRSIITVSVLVARNQSAELPFFLGQALDSGLTPVELSELLTHLAFYSGWANALAAARVTQKVFEERSIFQTSHNSSTLLPINEQVEAKREASVSANFGATAPGLVQMTSDILFRDLWLRPELCPRDRCLITICAVIATSQFHQLDFYLNRAMDNGLTAVETSEAMTQLAFYTGWPSVYSALPIVKNALSARPAPEKI